MKSRYETPLAFALACLLLSGAAVLAAGLDEVFNPETPGLHWVDLEAESDPGLPPEPAWPSASLSASNPAELLLSPPDDAPPWPEVNPAGLTLDGLLFPLEDAPPFAPPLGI